MTHTADDMHDDSGAPSSAISPEAVAGLVERLENERPTNMLAVLDVYLQAAQALTSLSTRLSEQEAEFAGFRSRQAAWEETRLANANLRNENGSLKFAIETEKVGAGYLTGRVDRLENENALLRRELDEARAATVAVERGIFRKRKRMTELKADRDSLKAEVGKLRAALGSAPVAMKLANALPGVSAEYDFEPVIDEVSAVYSGTKPAAAPARHMEARNE